MVFKNKETKIDSKDALNFVWIAEAFFLGVIARVLSSVFVIIVR